MQRSIGEKVLVTITVITIIVYVMANLFIVSALLW